jgi:hypothetical protein
MLKYATFLERKQVRISKKFVPGPVCLDETKTKTLQYHKEVHLVIRAGRRALQAIFAQLERRMVDNRQHLKE